MPTGLVIEDCGVSQSFVEVEYKELKFLVPQPFLNQLKLTPTGKEVSAVFRPVCLKVMLGNVSVDVYAHLKGDLRSVATALSMKYPGPVYASSHGRYLACWTNGKMDFGVLPLTKYFNDVPDEVIEETSF